MRPNESFIGQPIRSLQTMLRVLAEDNSAYQAIIPDGIYGPETLSAVSVFQRRHGLPVTGVTNLETWEAITEAFEPALLRAEEAQPLTIVLNPGQEIRRGERHPHIYLAQGILAVLANTYESISRPGLTGLLDDITSDALSSFQQISGLPMTGILDKRTWKHLALQYPLAANLFLDQEQDYG